MGKLALRQVAAGVVAAILLLALALATLHKPLAQAYQANTTSIISFKLLENISLGKKVNAIAFDPVEPGLQSVQTARSPYGNSRETGTSRYGAQVSVVRIHLGARIFQQGFI